ncbi:thiopeptide-type bacteriocin biosynthesis protein [Niabella pedocola]|uniref:Thiopeptide-type bacteriocin biosynthesis protein n=1 Tax=Niabella pedocola TaxID=1752077 RepID=A0ABS8PTM0_9BACT|nr:thiopeptide-type bacteriocin biosynthesis protein [Niabella pedocola]MCD2424426.1 thiopeptide-type bacteriocin biosynthesis protein [Niabella pedocola]
MRNFEGKTAYIPGSEWLYFKIHSGPKFQEEFLMEHLSDRIINYKKRGMIDKFFFVRYSDEYGPHLRLRFKISNSGHLLNIIEDISKTTDYFLSNGLINRMSIDTYFPELDRYGSNSMQFAETIFSVNSFYMLYLFGKTRDYNDIWLSSVKIADSLLTQFEMSLQDKHVFYEKCFKAFALEANYRKLPNELKLKFRNNRNLIEMIFSEHAEIDCFQKELAIEESNAVQEILKLKTDGCLEIGIEDLLMSLIHMHNNRVFRTNPRLHELVIYYMMSNYYKSNDVREKQKMRNK